MKRKLKICFCTVVKNRLHHLKETIIKNIQFNSDYEELQFLVLDYNSEDGLQDWMMSNMSKYIGSGKLIFFRTNEPAFFHRSHSRNMAMRLADCEIVCNVDADNFTGPSFAKYINDCFQVDKNIFICAHSLATNNPADVLGRVCVRKSDFLTVGGYDESMESYGFEDYDIINRLGLLGLKKMVIEEPAFLNAIRHSDYERISEEKIMKLFHSLYVNYISVTKSKIIILLKNSVCMTGKLIDWESVYSANPTAAFSDRKYDHKYTLENEKWILGEWRENDTALFLNQNTNVIEFKKTGNGRLKYYNKTFYPINDTGLVVQILFFYSQFLNRNKMKSNLDNGPVLLLNEKSGTGVVFKNFENSKKIFV